MLPVGASDVSAAGVRREQDKLFHVSPFISMAMRYRFRISPPGKEIKLRCRNCEG